MLSDRTFCEATDCAESFETHKWAAIRAHADGWFQGKDGRVWCPAHVPGWLVGWRLGRER